MSTRSSGPTSRRRTEPERGRVLAWLLLVWGLVALVAPRPAQADWVNLTGAETAPNIAEIRILEDRVAVALEIAMDDVAAFGLAEGGPGLTFRVRTDAGAAPLPVEITARDVRERKDRYSPFAGAIDPRNLRRMPEAPTGDVVYVEAEFSFAGAPGRLLFAPPMDEDGTALVTLGFLAFHKAAPINDFRYLARTEVLLLDWEDAWYTRFENRNLRRHHASPLMSFLYVEPRQVRHEVLVRVRDLIEWTGADAPVDGPLTPEQAEDLRLRGERFFPTRNPLAIDGTPTEPQGSRLVFLRITPAGLRVVEDGSPIDASASIAGSSLTYPIDTLPQGVNLEWDLVADRTERIPTTVSDPAGPLPSYLEPGDTTIEWTNFLRTWEEPVLRPVAVGSVGSVVVPLASVGCVAGAFLALAAVRRSRGLRRGAWSVVAVVAVLAAFLLGGRATIAVPNPLGSAPTPEAAARVGADMLGAVGVAFLEKVPADFERALAPLVQEGSLRDVAIDLRSAFAVPAQGGGVASVDAIQEVLAEEIAPLGEGAGFRTLLSWNADASARHWGHVDRRTFRFRALVELVPVDGFFRLLSFTVLEAEPVG